ncbi:MAG: LCP family protein, partial [Nostoc sp.]
MIKQIEWSDNPVTSQQVAEFETEVRSPQLQRTENQVTPVPVPDSEEEEVELNQPANQNRSVVESVGAIPNQLYERL